MQRSALSVSAIRDLIRHLTVRDISVRPVFQSVKTKGNNGKP